MEELQSGNNKKPRAKVEKKPIDNDSNGGPIPPPFCCELILEKLDELESSDNKCCNQLEDELDQIKNELNTINNTSNNILNTSESILNIVEDQSQCCDNILNAIEGVNEHITESTNEINSNVNNVNTNVLTMQTDVTEILNILQNDPPPPIDCCAELNTKLNYIIEAINRLAIAVNWTNSTICRFMQNKSDCNCGH